MPKLGKRSIDQAKPRDTDYFIWDSDLPGFGLRIHPSGRMTYVVQYRSKGRTQRHAFGTHSVYTAETARKEARVLPGHVAQGGNPSAEKQLDLKAVTIKQLSSSISRMQSAV